MRLLLGRRCSVEHNLVKECDEVIIVEVTSVELCRVEEASYYITELYVIVEDLVDPESLTSEVRVSVKSVYIKSLNEIVDCGSLIS